jgi:hypothetical protein
MPNQRAFDPDRYPDPDSDFDRIAREIQGKDAFEKIEPDGASPKADEAYEAWRRRPSLWRRLFARLFGIN